ALRTPAVVGSRIGASASAGAVHGVGRTAARKLRLNGHRDPIDGAGRAGHMTSLIIAIGSGISLDLSRRLPIRTAHSSLKVRHQAKARLALKRAAFDGRRLGNRKAGEERLIFVFRTARISDAPVV